MHGYSSRRVCTQITASTCWWEGSSLRLCSATLFAHPKRQNLSSNAIGTIPSFPYNSLVGICCFCGSLSQFHLARHCKTRLASLFWHASADQVGSSFVLSRFGPFQKTAISSFSWRKFPVTAWFSSSFLSLRSVMMCGVIVLACPESLPLPLRRDNILSLHPLAHKDGHSSRHVREVVFLSHSASPYSVSA